MNMHEDETENIRLFDLAMTRATAPPEHLLNQQASAVISYLRYKLQPGAVFSAPKAILDAGVDGALHAAPAPSAEDFLAAMNVPAAPPNWQDVADGDAFFTVVNMNLSKKTSIVVRHVAKVVAEGSILLLKVEKDFDGESVTIKQVSNKTIVLELQRLCEPNRFKELVCRLQTWRVVADAPVYLPRLCTMTQQALPAVSLAVPVLDDDDILDMLDGGDGSMFNEADFPTAYLGSDGFHTFVKWMIRHGFTGSSDKYTSFLDIDCPIDIIAMRILIDRGIVVSRLDVFRMQEYAINLAAVSVRMTSTCSNPKRLTVVKCDTKELLDAPKLVLVEIPTIRSIPRLPYSTPRVP
jgi:hypothetical protein